MQIQKYLNGELDARAMHKLEMEALHDPFLMDALEGYDNTAASQQLNLADLSNRLQQRTSSKNGFTIPWKVWPLAASVLITLTVGGLYVNKSANTQLQSNNIGADKNTPPPLVAATDTIKNADTVKKAGVLPAAPVKVPLIAVIKKSKQVKQSAGAVYQQEISAADNKTTSPQTASSILAEPATPAPAKPTADAVKKDNPNLGEIVVMGYVSQNKKDTAAGSGISLTDKNKTTAKSAAPLQFKLQGKVDGVTADPSPGYSSKAAAESLYIAGTITSRDDGSPVIGAAIRIKGTNKSTVTDVNGKFALASPVGHATLDIASIGYEHKEISANRGDSVKIALNQNSAALSEVVVTGYGRKNDDGEETAVVSAHPQLGWGSLKKYLQANEVQPDGIAEGTVSITFSVFPSGVLDGFTIKKGLDDTTNQKAIDLIKNGPSWAGSSNGKPEKVTVKVKFHKQK